MAVSTLLAVILLAVVAFFFFNGFLKTWREFRGQRVITCPENQQPAAVAVAAVDAAKWYALSGELDLHLRSCSRWPEMAGCGQECLRQVEDHPAECLVRNIVASWYQGERCVYCNREIGPIVWHERPPAVRLPDGTTREWKNIAAQDLPRIFATADPVCWPCHVFETFRAEHPEMIVTRTRPVEPPRVLTPTMNVY